MVTNYRPISLLSIFNKILERLMYNRLIKYFEKSSTIFYQQFGICSSHSTGHALLLLIDKIQKAIDSKTCSCGIFRYWCKAFDSVDHHVLLDKLEYYGIRGLARECRYLTKTGSTYNHILGLRCPVQPYIFTVRLN